MVRKFQNLAVSTVSPSSRNAHPEVSMLLDEKKFCAAMERVAGELKADPNHRLLSWDHAWEYWNSFAKEQEADESLAALHLGFYLASWGMYRGSSDLLYRDYKALIPAVCFLKEQAGESTRKDCIFDINQEPEDLAEVLRGLANALSRKLQDKLARPEKKTVNVSDTLLSKILLNTLSCVPAFDTEVKAALRDILGRNYPTGNGFDKKRLVATIKLARANLKLVTDGQELLKKKTCKKYPLTKVFDLYLWNHGFDISREAVPRLRAKRIGPDES